MKRYKTIIFILLFSFICSIAYSTEFEAIYKQWGDYSYIDNDDLKIYYPDSIKDSIPRILTSFADVREKVLVNFPNFSNYKATIVLDDHDDIIDSTADSRFDLINLSIFDEIGVVSARSYPLEKRFALSLSKTLIKQSSSNVSFAWRRSLAMLSIPHWFLEGMALNYAFPLDSIHYSRLLDMARYNRLYSLNDLNTITSQPTLVKEEMLFQAHSMLAYWESTYKKGADLELVISIVRNFRGFDKAFKKYYGVSLNEAYKSYKEYIANQSKIFNDLKEPDILDVDYIKHDAKIFRSYLKISENERLWVSSKRYTTENYDLYYRNGISKPIILQKNVHPNFIYDSDNKQIIIGKYDINGKREKRLSLISVDLQGKTKILVSERGSFKPLAKFKDSVYYINSKSGKTRVMSYNLKNNTIKEELNLGNDIRPLDITLDTNKNRVFYTFKNSAFTTNLAEMPLNSDNTNQNINILINYDGEIKDIKYYDNKLWCACDSENFLTQLFYFDEKEKKLRKFSNIPGGVWDISFSDNSRVEVSTLYKGGFSIASLPLEEEPYDSITYCNPVTAKNEEIKEEVKEDIKSNKYKSEYHDTLWKPVLSKDSEGNVIGIYNYRSDRLGRNSFMITPTYGIKSHDWGYLSRFTNRFDMVEASISLNDLTKKKTYFETDYYERIKSRRFQFDYPLKLDMKLSFGFDLTQRGIAKIKKNPRNLVPTEGKDHFYFIELYQKSIRTEPYNNIFPRKGRTVELTYRLGDDSLFGGDMEYDSMSLKWNEYIPLNNYYVLTLSSWLAQDDKHNGIRRPDDLYLGSDEYMRAFNSSYKSGDKLRYASLNLARPIHIDLPQQISWLQNEFSSLGIFWEMGDTRNEGKFDYDYDRGVEFASNLLIFRRIPISFKAGYAVRNGQDGHDSYFKFYTEELSEILK